MPTIEYLFLGFRHKFFILSLTILLTICGYYFAISKLKTNYTATLFVSIAVKDEGKIDLYSSTLENLQAADLFTETIQGWFKNPSFINRIKTQAENLSNLTAKKQEKQNLVINFTTNTIEESEKNQKAIWNILNSEINLYNTATSTDFSIAISNQDYLLKESNSKIYIFLALLIGLIISYLCAYFYEKSQGFLLSKNELYKILKLKPLYQFKNFKHLQNQQIEFANITMAIFDNNQPQILYFTPEIKENILNIFNSSKKIKKNIKFLLFSNQLNELENSSPTIIICQLGKTLLADLAKIKKLNLAHYEVIIFNQL